jgi:hypothetical protein
MTARHVAGGSSRLPAGDFTMSDRATDLTAGLVNDGQCVLCQHDCPFGWAHCSDCVFAIVYGDDSDWELPLDAEDDQPPLGVPAPGACNLPRCRTCGHAVWRFDGVEDHCRTCLPF